MKYGNLNAEMLHVRDALRAPWSDAERAAMPTPTTAQTPSMPAARTEQAGKPAATGDVDARR